MDKGLLLKEDQDRLDYLLVYLHDNDAKITPNLKSTPKKIYSSFDIRDLESKRIQYLMRGDDLSLQDLVIRSANNYHIEYKLGDHKTKEDDGRIILSGDAYLISDHFLSIVREIKYLKRLEKDAFNMILKAINDPLFDSRNILIDEGGVWKCDRLKNEDDPRLLGELVKKELVMSRATYENSLLRLKKD